MKLFAALATLALAATSALPAAAQMMVYKNHPTVWHRPAHCTGSFKAQGDRWKEGVCNRVETSTGGSSHNIRFKADGIEMLYVTSFQAPTEVHAVVISLDNTSGTFAATGKCEFTARNTVICSALADDRSFGIVNGAVFGQEFPELRAILR